MSVGVAKETPKETAAYWGYRGAEWLAMTLPEGVGRWLFEAGGRLAHAKLHGVRATVAANQARVLGAEPGDERVELATREAFGLYARFWYDAFRIRSMPLGEFNRRTTIVNLENVDRALGAGRGAVCALPHMGNWDVAGHWFGANGYRIAAVAEELEPRRLYELFLRHREELGMRIIGLARDGHVGQRLKQLLSENWMVALVADRDLSGRGIEVEMFGARRSVPAGPALLSLSAGAPLLVCPVYTRPDGWEIRIGEPLEIERNGVMREDVAALSRLMAERFERAIAAEPTDWHMFQPAWEEAASTDAVEPAASIDPR
ncbi:MAG TPA: phosphatidylinositol mannoside acyltransferase [Actinomycetota bacterium]|nr:phosphatidylinositol mannoside acyltransferase [Actinomycetota bacterium]